MFTSTLYSHWDTASRYLSLCLHEEFNFLSGFPSPRGGGDPLNVFIILTNQRPENDFIGQSASRELDSPSPEYVRHDPGNVYLTFPVFWSLQPVSHFIFPSHKQQHFTTRSGLPQDSPPRYFPWPQNWPWWWRQSSQEQHQHYWSQSDQRKLLEYFACFVQIFSKSGESTCRLVGGLFWLIYNYHDTEHYLPTLSSAHNFPPEPWPGAGVPPLTSTILTCVSRVRPIVM